MCIDCSDLGHGSLGLHTSWVAKGTICVSGIAEYIAKYICRFRYSGDLTIRTPSKHIHSSSNELTLQYTYNAPQSSRSHRLRKSATDTPIPG